MQSCKLPSSLTLPFDKAKHEMSAALTTMNEHIKACEKTAGNFRATENSWRHQKEEE